jgi:hypothetical protein
MITDPVHELTATRRTGYTLPQYFYVAEEIF